MNGADYYLLTLLPFWKSCFDFVSRLAWPLAALLIAIFYRSDLKALFGRIIELSPTGAKFIAPEQRSLSSKPPNAISGLKLLPGLERTQAIADIEVELHNRLQNVPEDQRIDTLVRELAQTRLDFHFARAYSIIFGSQIRLLKALREAGGSLTKEIVNKVFLETQAQFEIHKNRTLDEYLHFLKSYFLIEETDQIVKITPTGSDFLLYLYRFALPEDRLF